METAEWRYFLSIGMHSCLRSGVWTIELLPCRGDRLLSRIAVIPPRVGRKAEPKMLASPCHRVVGTPRNKSSPKLVSRPRNQENHYISILYEKYSRADASRGLQSG